MGKPRFDMTMNLGHVLIAVGMIGGGIGGGLTVYSGVFRTLTELTIKVNTLETATSDYAASRQQQFVNVTNINQLKELTSAIKISNEKMLDQLTGIRVDLAKMQGQLNKPQQEQP